MVPTTPKHATLHSVISAWARCGRIDVKSSALRGNRASLLSYDFELAGQLALLEGQAFGGRLSAAEIIDWHTHVPLFAGLLPQQESMRWRTLLLSTCALRDVQAQAIRRLSSVEATTLRRCPICVGEDRKKYGCAHWRLYHQWPVARHCVKHGVLLETRCGGCGAPFQRGKDPKLADDPCPYCGTEHGAATQAECPPGYWPMLHAMHGLLVGRGLPEGVSMLDLTPLDLTARQRSRQQRAVVERLLSQWNARSLEHIAALLGVNWIWFNETERAAHIKRLPLLVSLAIGLSEQLAERQRLERGPVQVDAPASICRIAA